MNKSIKIIVFGIVAIAGCYFAYFFYEILRYSHSSDWQTYKQYMWIFKDSAKRDIDTTYGYSYVKKQDIYNNFQYRRFYNVIIWEFKDLGIAELKNIDINQNVNFEKVEFVSGEVLNKRSDIEIMVKFGFTLNNTMNINLDEYSKVENCLEGTNYKGFYGSINKMLLSNYIGGPQIIINNNNIKRKAVFLVYKGHNSFYVIMISSEKPFDESIISILNLT